MDGVVIGATICVYCLYYSFEVAKQSHRYYYLSKSNMSQTQRALQHVSYSRWNALSRNIIVTQDRSWSCPLPRSSFREWWDSTNCAYLPFCDERHWCCQATTPSLGGTARSPRICCIWACLITPPPRTAPHSRSKATSRIISCTSFPLFVSVMPFRAWRLSGSCMPQKPADLPGASWAGLLLKDLWEYWLFLRENLFYR